MKLSKYYYFLCNLTPRQILSTLYSKSHSILRSKNLLIKNTHIEDALFAKRYLVKQFGNQNIDSVKEALLESFYKLADKVYSPQALNRYIKNIKKNETPTVTEIIKQADDLYQLKFNLWQADNLSFEQKVDWSSPKAVSKEWLHSLNRFYFLDILARAFLLTKEDEYAAKGTALIQDWIVSCPYGESLTWQSMNIAERIVNWLNFIALCRESASVDKDIFFKITKSIFVQTLCLGRHFEYRANNNHLIFNARALVYTASLIPQFKKSKSWLKYGLKSFTKEYHKQTLADGFNIESCSGYHLWMSDTLLKFLLAFDRLDVKYDATLRKILNKKLDVLLHLSRPDLTIPLLGDFKDCDVQVSIPEIFALGAAYFERTDYLHLGKSAPAEICLHMDESQVKYWQNNKGKHPKKQTKAFDEVGYYFYRSSWEEDADYLCVDCGQISRLKSNPGHGHADALSFELVISGHPIFTDPGTFTYDNSKERQYFRSTKAHNTLIIDDKNQSELWSAFRIAQKATAKTHCWETGDNWLYFRGSHDGYKRLKKGLVHTRHIFLKKNKYVFILDQLSGLGDHKATQYFHFPSTVTVEGSNDSNMKIEKPVEIQLLPLNPASIKTILHKASNHNLLGFHSTSYHKMNKGTTLSIDLIDPRADYMGLFINPLTNSPKTVQKITTAVSPKHPDRIITGAEFKTFELKDNQNSDYFSFSKTGCFQFSIQSTHQKIETRHFNKTCP